MAYSVVWNEVTPDACIVGVRIDDGERLFRSADVDVYDEERALVATAHARRKGTFLGGRLALRLAAASLGHVLGPVYRNDRGAPLLDVATLTGSISHKDEFAVAVVKRREHGTLGIDIEHARERDTDIARHVLTTSEQARLGALDMSAAKETVLRFSLKEAVYKVLDPHLRRYIGFLEVEVDPHRDGATRVTTILKDGPCAFDVDAIWVERDGYFVSTAEARRRS